MARSDVFALGNSGLNAFLFAEVGTELNGSRLTILSVMARLEKDPWAEAAQWAKLPPAIATEYLAQAIAKMPLGAQALADASATAARLIVLLPSKPGPVPQSSSAPVAGASPVGWWALLALFCVVAVSLAAQIFFRR